MKFSKKTSVLLYIDNNNHLLKHRHKSAHVAVWFWFVGFLFFRKGVKSLWKRMRWMGVGKAVQLRKNTCHPALRWKSWRKNKSVSISPVSLPALVWPNIPLLLGVWYQALVTSCDTSDCRYLHEWPIHLASFLFGLPKSWIFLLENCWLNGKYAILYLCNSLLLPSSCSSCPVE